MNRNVEWKHILTRQTGSESHLTNNIHNLKYNCNLSPDLPSKYNI